MGARKIDYHLFDKFSEEFKKKHGCDLKTSPRCRLRMLDAIEKARKLLTANKVTDINCESLMDDEDFQRHFTREDLEAELDFFLRDFTTFLKFCLAKSGIAY